MRAAALVEFHPRPDFICGHDTAFNQQALESQETRLSLGQLKVIVFASRRVIIMIVVMVAHQVVSPAGASQWS